MFSTATNYWAYRCTDAACAATEPLTGTYRRSHSTLSLLERERLPPLHHRELRRRLRGLPCGEARLQQSLRRCQSELRRVRSRVRPEPELHLGRLPVVLAVLIVSRSSTCRECGGNKREWLRDIQRSRSIRWTPCPERIR